MRKNILMLVRLVERCNNHCTYCYNDEYSAKANRDEIDPNYLINLIKIASCQYPIVELILHGGEPLLWGKENFYKLIEYCEGKENLNINIQTNMIDFDEEWYTIFKRLGVSVVSTSFDGINHERTRGRYEKTVEKLKLFKEIASKDPEPIRINSIQVLVPGLKYDLVKDYYLAKELGISNVSQQLVDPYNTMYKPSKEDYLQLAEDYNAVTEELFKTNKEIPQYLSSFLKQTLCEFSEACPGFRIGIRANGIPYNCLEGWDENYKILNHPINNLEDFNICLKRLNKLKYKVLSEKDNDPECNICSLKRSCNKGCPIFYTRFKSRKEENGRCLFLKSIVNFYKKLTGGKDNES